MFRVLLALRASSVAMVLPDHREKRGHQDRQVNLVMTAIRALREQLAEPVLRVLRGQLVPLEHRAPQEFRVPRALALPALPVPLE